MKDISHNFRLKRSQTIKSRNTVAHTYVHTKLGTEVVYLQNDGPEFFYTIGFCTPAYKDTGLTHILEHCVLAGSEKYPVKDPFRELLASSHYTFMNAMTYPEFTMYPVGSTNETSFRKLVDVYTDAVFKPLVRTTPGIFYQEGWRYEKDEKGKYKASGIVFNEMKGYFNSHEGYFGELAIKNLFKGTPTGAFYGGYPSSIMSLTHKELVDYHLRYYHPSNARILLRGNIKNIEYYLNFLGEQYFSDYEKEIRYIPEKPEVFKKIAKKTVAIHTSEKNYSLGTASVINTKGDQNKQLFIDFISYVLGHNQHGLLNKYLADRSLVESFEMYFESDLTSPLFVQRATVKKNQDARMVHDAIDTFYTSELESFIDEDMLFVLWNNFVVSYVTALENTGGMGIAGLVMPQWFAGSNPEDVLAIEESLTEVEKELSKEYFMKVIKEIVGNNTHTIKLTVIPDKKNSEFYEKTIKEKEKKANKDTLKHAQFDRMVSDLDKFQNQDTSTLTAELFKPLSISKLSSRARRLLHKSHAIGNAQVISTTDKSLVGHTKLVFQVSHLSTYEQLQYKLLAQALPEANYQFADSDALYFKRHFAQYSASLSHIEQEDGSARSYLVIDIAYKKHIKKETLKQLHKALSEYTYTANTLKKRYEQTVTSYKENIDNFRQDHSYMRAAAYHSEYARIVDETNKIGGYETLKKNKKILQEALNLPRISSLPLVLTASNHMLNSFVKNFDTTKYTTKRKKITPHKKTNSELVFTSSTANNNALAWPSKVTQDQAGYMSLIKSIITLNYLFDTVRLQGGAYGGNLVSSRHGLGMLKSHVDPHAQRTFHIFTNTDAMKMAIENSSLNSHKVSVLGRMDQPLSPGEVLEVLVSQELSDVSIEHLDQMRKDIKEANTKDLVKTFKKFTKKINEGVFVTIGSGVGMKYEKRTKV